MNLYENIIREWDLAHPRESLAWILSPWLKIKVLQIEQSSPKVHEWIARPSHWIFEAHIQHVSPGSKCLLGIDRDDSNDPIPCSNYWDYEKKGSLFGIHNPITEIMLGFGTLYFPDILRILKKLYMVFHYLLKRFPM